MSDYITTTLREGSEVIAWAVTPTGAQAVRARGDRRRRLTAAGTSAAVMAVAAAGAIGYPLVADSGAPAPAAASLAVPNVTGDTVAQATRVMTHAGLSVGKVRRQDSASIGLNLVLGTAPAAGASVAKGARITLVVVSGAASAVVVPDAVGESLRAATAQLTQLGLNVQTAATAARGAARGTVVRQSPLAGTFHQTGSTVTLFVAG